MAKFNHENSYFYMFENELFDVEYDFSNNLATGDSLQSVSIEVRDADGYNRDAVVPGGNVVSPDAFFTVQGSNAPGVGVYEIHIVGTTVAGKDHIGKIICEIFGSVTLNEKIGDPSANSYTSLDEANEYMRNVRGHPNVWDTLSIEGRKRLLIQAGADLNRFNYIGKKYYDNQTMEFPRNEHSVITGDVATPITLSSFKNTSFTSDTYGTYKSNTDYWKYGTIHITAATPLYDIRQIESNNIITDIVTASPSFSATPTTNTDFIAFEPLDIKIKEAQCEQALHLLESEGSGTLQNYISLGARRVAIGDTEVEFGTSGGTMKPSISSKAKRLISEWLQRYRKVLRA